MSFDPARAISKQEGAAHMHCMSTFPAVDPAIAIVHATICSPEDFEFECDGKCRRAVFALAQRTELPGFVEDHVLARMNTRKDVISADGYDPYAGRHEIVDSIDEAEVVTSNTGEMAPKPKMGWWGGTEDESIHRPILDIDFPAALIPSTTPGHFHLYLDKPMGWSKYSALLGALATAGIVEQGYAGASLEREYTSVRLPWVKKEPGELLADVA